MVLILARMKNITPGRPNKIGWYPEPTYTITAALRDIAEESNKREIEQALGLCTGFVDRVSGESVSDAEGISLYPQTSPVSSTETS
jgi:hypothetical protein